MYLLVLNEPLINLDDLVIDNIKYISVPPKPLKCVYVSVYTHQPRALQDKLCAWHQADKTELSYFDVYKIFFFFF